eukprot:scaffold215360_cov48-Prasinocladus_malaysianus.AAC.1
MPLEGRSRSPQSNRQAVNNGGQLHRRGCRESAAFRRRHLLQPARDRSRQARRCGRLPRPGAYVYLPAL